MKPEKKSKKHLMEELAEMRQEIAELETEEVEHKRGRAAEAGNSSAGTLGPIQ